MHEAAAPRTTIPETAFRLEISQVAFRGGALLRHAKRIFLGSDGHRDLIVCVRGGGGEDRIESSMERTEHERDAQIFSSKR